MAVYTISHPKCGATKTIRTGPGDPPPDFDAELDCIPGHGCCGYDHHHGQAANECPAEHDGDCAAGVPGCTVCRPVVITVVDLGVPLGAG